MSVTGHQDYAEGSVYAILRSYEELQKKFPVDNLSCLLVCPTRPENLPEYVRHIACKPFSYLEYNVFVLYSLDDLIETDFALIVQNDGFVLNGNNWREEFLEYDYIGAPLLYMGRAKENGVIEPIVNWEGCLPYYKSVPDDVFIGQNGGFSLRSKKLLGMPRKLDMNVLISHPKKLEMGRQPVALEYDDPNHNEDIILTIIYRKLLESQGIQFAPPKIAAYFAGESVDAIHSTLGVSLDDVFGVHTFGCLVLTHKNALYMQKKMWFYGIDICTNILCKWLNDSGLSIEVPYHFFPQEELEKAGW
ncbi:hypothetical protein BKK51_12790 [Rodentibacter trehalosifermentans]|uniref:DUF5672 domain-containing protein n=1 Tax=Rodentibacter trehalosifermentans TaxID=1908263 RepID=A0A1V3IM75_9PAST|nr:DUF5672 family protein [Rodentibacter trehalosifermentans]OOF42549.1 hypothetical protein BKK51_12790 [Rodentibacter trehalosifermentans]OOF48347.1 hypothetical protein BKK52_06285 [Rodentibacter trehalosifermentans]